MTIDQEIEINLFAQDLIDIKHLRFIFNDLNMETKKIYLERLILLITQSKVLEIDIDSAIIKSKLKSTFTPCVILKRGLTKSNFNKIINLPNNELDKVFLLLVYLFKIAYNRRFELEKNNPTKWWYWDFSDDENLRKLELVRSNIIN